MRSRLLEYLDMFSPEQIRYHSQLWDLYPVEDKTIKGNIGLVPFLYIDLDSSVQLSGPVYNNLWHGLVNVNIISEQHNISGTIHYVLGVKHGLCSLTYSTGITHITEYDGDVIVAQNINTVAKLIKDRTDVVVKDDKGEWIFIDNQLKYYTECQDINIHGSVHNISIYRNNQLLFSMENANNI